MITLLLRYEEICFYSGMFDKLCLIANSLTEKGISCSLKFTDGGASDCTEGAVITFGNAESGNAVFNIPLKTPFEEISEKVFGIAGGLIYGNFRQITVKLFGQLTDAYKKIAEIEKSCNNCVSAFLYREGHITTIKILCGGGEGETGAVSDIFSAFKKNIYAEEDISIDKRLLELLSVRGKILSVAESLTGGIIISTLIDNAGASEVIYEGLVTYSNDSKIKRLGIDENIIKNYGAVSYETAYEMAAGLLAHKTCGIAVATTGIAGPSGGSLTKPVGLTFISVGTAEGIHVYKHIFSGNRRQVREAAAQAAIFYAIKRLKDSSIDYEEIQIK